MLFKRKKPEPRQEQAWAPQDGGTVNEPSYIGKDTRIHGNVFTDTEIHIDGMLEGSVQAHTCLVDVHGEVRGSIGAQFVVVRGRVLGPITATQVTIQKGAHVEGDVLHEGLSIEHGAFVMGSITQSSLPDAEAVHAANAPKFSTGLYAPEAAPAEDDDFNSGDPKVLHLNAQR